MSDSKGLNLRTIPPDVRHILLTEQTKEKKKRGVKQYSLCLTIYKIVREWERCYNSQKEKKS